jgi:succinate dehydrogenase hydrophobic anchor subunit
MERKCGLRRKSPQEVFGMLIVSGVICVLLGAFIFYKLKPQEGQPPSPWIASDFRGSAVAIFLLCLILAGIGLVLKGLTS